MRSIVLVCLFALGCATAPASTIESLCADCVEEGEPCERECSSLSGGPLDAEAVCDGDLRCVCVDLCPLRCGGVCMGGGVCFAGVGTCRRAGPIGCAQDGTAWVECLAVPGC